MSWKTQFPENNRYFETKNGILYCGSCLEILKQFPNESVDCVVTSPPYFSLRNYGEKAETVWGGDSNCNHEWEIVERLNSSGGFSNPEKANTGREKLSLGRFTVSEKVCKKCGAWKGQLGLEPDFNLYIEHLLLIFDEVWRVLKPTGTLWVNIADTYNGSKKGVTDRKVSEHLKNTQNLQKRLCKSVKRKSLLLIPERFAIGMLERGWILRNKIIWYKTNGIPESVKDRFTKSYEYIYFFTKSEKYYFRQQFEPVKESSIRRLRRVYSNFHKHAQLDGQWNPLRGMYKKLGNIESFNGADHLVAPFDPAKGRNMRDVWSFATAQFSAKKLGVEEVDHFAVFPEELPRRCIEAGCPEGGIVLDIFAGVGTTLVVAEKFGRRWIGIEINPDYCEIARRRVEKTLLPLFEQVGS